MRALVFAVALFSGCAYTPTEFREEGQRHVRRLSLPPHAAAPCIARNLDVRPGLVATQRPLKDGQELLVRIAGTGLFAVIAEVMPSGPGSEATIWLTPNVMIGKDALVPLMVDGC